jgi:hypothetical protein
MSRIWEGLTSISFRFVLHQIWARHKIRGSPLFMILLWGKDIRPVIRHTLPYWGQNLQRDRF